MQTYASLEMKKLALRYVFLLYPTREPVHRLYSQFFVTFAEHEKAGSINCLVPGWKITPTDDAGVVNIDKNF